MIINPLLLRLASDTSHKGVSVECPELRIAPTLPPQAAVSAARSFADLDSVSEKFGRFRENHTNAMHTTVVMETQPSRKEDNHRNRTKVAVDQVGVAYSRAPRLPPLADSVQTHMQTHTFLKCILEITDSSFRILSPEDSSKCLFAFLQRAESLLSRDRQGVAASYVALAKNRGVTVEVQDVVDSLRDPKAALSDKGLHDAAIVMLAQILRVVLVVRSQGGFVSVVPNPSIPYASTEHAVLLGWREAQYAIEECEGPTIADVRSRIFDANPELLKSIRDATKLKKMSVDEVRSLAAKVAFNAPKAHFPTKAKIVEALLAIGSTSS